MNDYWAQVLITLMMKSCAECNSSCSERISAMDEKFPMLKALQLLLRS